MTELETAVEWLRDMRRVGGPHCEYATTLLDRLYDAELADGEIERLSDELGEIPTQVEPMPGVNIRTKVEAAMTMLDNVRDALDVDKYEDVLGAATEASETRFSLICALQRAGVVEPDDAPDGDALVRLLAMFLPDTRAERASVAVGAAIRNDVDA